MEFQRAELLDILDALDSGIREIDDNIDNGFKDYSKDDIEFMQTEKESFVKLESKINRFLYIKRG